MLHSVRVIPRLQQHGYSLSLFLFSASLLPPVRRPSDTRVRGRACTRYIADTTSERASEQRFADGHAYARAHIFLLIPYPARSLLRYCRLFEVKRSTDHGLGIYRPPCSRTCSWRRRNARGDFRREKADFGEDLIIRKETAVLHVDDDDETWLNVNNALR